MFLSRRALLSLVFTFCIHSLALAATPTLSVEDYRLPNGLRVLLHVDRSAPIVHVEVWYKVGSKDEDPGKTGFAHLFEHLMFQGTKHIPEDAFSKYLSKAGASSQNGTTNTDRTNYYETLPASQLELALWMESSRMGYLLDRPAWDKTFANQRDVVKNERRERVENVPMGGIAAIQRLALFPEGHPYRHEIIGSMADLDRATVADVQDFYDRYYAPGNAVLFIGGDLEVAQTKEWVEKYFGPITPGKEVVQKSPAPIPPRKAEQRIAMEAKVNLPHGRMAWTTLPVFQAGDGELDMVAEILGGGPSSRLYQRLILDLKIAHSVAVYHMSHKFEGLFEIAYTPLPGKSLKEIETVVDEELMRMARVPPTDEEIDRARNQLKTRTIRDLESLAGIGSRLLYYAVFAPTPQYLQQDLARYEQATPASLQGAVKAHLALKKRVVIQVAPNPKAPTMGKTLHPLPAEKPSPTRPLSPLSKPRISPDAPFRSTLPEAAKNQKFRFPTAQRFRLRNGLEVVLVESHKLPLVRLDLVVKTGSGGNPRGKEGLAQMVAGMLDEGTDQRSASQIATEVARLGASLTGHVSWDASTLALSVLSENLEPALEIWAEVLLSPAFSLKDFERVKDRTQASLARMKDNPKAVASLVFQRGLWGEAHPYGSLEAGHKQSIENLAPEDLRRFHETYFRPNNAVLVVAGDIQEKALRARLTPLLATWKAKKVPTIRIAKVEAPEKTRILLVDRPGAPQSSLRLGLPGIERKNPDYHRALVTNNILGGPLKRLNMNLREIKGWTYGIGSQFDMRRAPGHWMVHGEVVANHTVDAVEEIISEIEKLRADAVPEQELREAKDQIMESFPARFATASQIAAQFANLAVHDLSPSEWAAFPKKIAAVTAKDVRSTARKYFRPSNLVITVVGDARSLQAPLAKLGPVEMRDLDGQPIPQAP